MQILNLYGDLTGTNTTGQLQKGRAPISGPRKRRHHEAVQNANDCELSCECIYDDPITQQNRLTFWGRHRPLPRRLSSLGHTVSLRPIVLVAVATEEEGLERECRTARLSVNRLVVFVVYHTPRSSQQTETIRGLPWPFGVGRGVASFGPRECSVRTVYAFPVLRGVHQTAHDIHMYITLGREKFLKNPTRGYLPIGSDPL